MLVNYLGESTFQNGIRDYLQQFKYKNAKTQDLWNSLEKAAGGKPVAQLMKSWTRQMGVLLIRLTKSYLTCLVPCHLGH